MESKWIVYFQMDVSLFWPRIPVFFINGRVWTKKNPRRLHVAGWLSPRLTTERTSRNIQNIYTVFSVFLVTTSTGLTLKSGRWGALSLRFFPTSLSDAEPTIQRAESLEMSRNYFSYLLDVTGMPVYFLTPSEVCPSIQGFPSIFQYCLGVPVKSRKYCSHEISNVLNLRKVADSVRAEV